MAFITHPFDASESCDSYVYPKTGMIENRVEKQSGRKKEREREIEEEGERDGGRMRERDGGKGGRKRV